MASQFTLFDIPETPKWSTKKDRGVYSIYRYGHAIVSYRPKDELSKRMAAVLLVQTKLGTYPEISSLFDWSDSNLYVLMRAYHKYGPLGLIKKKTGPKDTKVTPEIHQFIRQAKGMTLNDMVNYIQDHHGVSLSDWMISEVKRGKAHRDQLNQLDLFSDGLLNSLLVQDTPEDGESATEHPEASEETLSLVPADPAPSSETLEELHQEMLGSMDDPLPMQVTAPVIVENEGTPQEPQIKVAIPEARPIPLSPMPKAGEAVNLTISRYTGGLLLLPFLQQIDPAGLFEKTRQAMGTVTEWGSQAYNLPRFMMTLIYLLWFRFSSIEDFKFVQPREFGVLIGAQGAPSVKTIRRYFPTILDGEVTEQWMLELVRRYVQLDVIQIGTLYFDGHKIPYYGHTDLPKGYLSSKRFPAKLIEQVFANDANGRPVFLRVHDTSVSFKTAVLGMIGDAQALWNESAIRAPLVVAFDRELYDTDLFATLDQMGVLFITWRKWDTPVTKEQLTEVIPLAPDGETTAEDEAIQYRAWRRKITVKDYEVEAISFLSEEKVKKDPERVPSTLVNNAFRFTPAEYPDYTPLTTGEIIDSLCHRWRQENFFRYSKHNERLDYNPSYATGERQALRTVANPLVKELEKAVRQQRKEIDQLNKKIAEKLTGRKKKDKPLEEILQQKSMQHLTQQKEQTEKHIETMRAQLSTLPERISHDREGQPSLELTLDGKRFLDVLRMVMYNAEQMLLDVFKRCYSDPRDVHKVLRAISEQGGTVEERSDALIVELNPLHIPAHQRATVELCRELNEMENKRMSDGKIIHFYVRE